MKFVKDFFHTLHLNQARSIPERKVRASFGYYSCTRYQKLPFSITTIMSAKSLPEKTSLKVVLSFLIDMLCNRHLISEQKLSQPCTEEGP